MKLIQSSKISLPIIYMVEDSKELSSLPMGVPYLRGESKDYREIVRLLEFEVLLRSAISTGFPFNWRKILKDNLFTPKITNGPAVYKLNESNEEIANRSLQDYIEGINYIVDIEYLKNLNIIPTWFTDIETAVRENIMNSILYNPSLYNKKLDMCSGDVELTVPQKNLIIIDISGSIPRAISKAILLLSKTMASQFYADLLITGSKSTLYDYTEMDQLDVDKVYVENGGDNDQIYFVKLLSIYRKYNTAIVFGDNDYPGTPWSNGYNKKSVWITIEEGKKLNKWDVKSVYSFHTRSVSEVAAYGRWFNTKDITHMKNWVTYLQ